MLTSKTGYSWHLNIKVKALSILPSKTEFWKGTPYPRVFVIFIAHRFNMHSNRWNKFFLRAPLRGSQFFRVSSITSSTIRKVHRYAQLMRVSRIWWAALLLFWRSVEGDTHTGWIKMPSSMHGHSTTVANTDRRLKLPEMNELPFVGMTSRHSISPLLTLEPLFEVWQEILKAR